MEKLTIVGFVSEGNAFDIVSDAGVDLDRRVAEWKFLRIGLGAHIRPQFPGGRKAQSQRRDEGHSLNAEWNK